MQVKGERVDGQWHVVAAEQGRSLEQVLGALGGMGGAGAAELSWHLVWHLDSAVRSLAGVEQALADGRCADLQRDIQAVRADMERILAYVQRKNISGGGGRG